MTRNANKILYPDPEKLPWHRRFYGKRCKARLDQHDPPPIGDNPTGRCGLVSDHRGPHAVRGFGLTTVWIPTMRNLHR